MTSKSILDKWLAIIDKVSAREGRMEGIINVVPKNAAKKALLGLFKDLTNAYKNSK